MSEMLMSPSYRREAELRGPYAGWAVAGEVARARARGEGDGFASAGSVNERRHDETPVGLLALAIRLDVVAGLEVLVHDLAL
jgi:hypothetical protein